MIVDFALPIGSGLSGPVRHAFHSGDMAISHRARLLPSLAVIQSAGGAAAAE